MLVHGLYVCEDLQAISTTKRLERRGGIKIPQMVFLSFRPPYRSVELASNQMLSDMFATLRPIFGFLPAEPTVEHWVVLFHGRAELSPF